MALKYFWFSRQNIIILPLEKKKESRVVSPLEKVT